MSRLFEKVKNEIGKIALDCAAAAQAMEATMKALEDIKEEFVPDINVGDNDWIPVTERLTENNDNVRVTAIRQENAAEGPSKRTNADRIRAMTDEELADAIFKNIFSTFGEVIPFCRNTEECSDMLDSCDGIPEHMCRECLFEWLQQPEGDVPR